MFKLDNKIAVVTGASSGIGRAIALELAQAGAKIIINYQKSASEAFLVAKHIDQQGGDAHVLQADISDRNAVSIFVKKIVDNWGEIDIWVNNAGADILTGDGAKCSDQTKLQQLIDVDLLGTIYCCWEVVPHMKQHGTIINVAWDLALHGLKGINPQMFAAAKAGIIGFSRSLAQSVAPDLRVNIIAPGWIETAFAKDMMAKQFRDKRTAEIPLARFGLPADVAGAIVFLASDAACYLTGEMIKISGGLS